ncbi:hypothetical protein KPH14_005186 [Odynerus spinipes]|uniref:acid phosphatase n=1 Tax=Odynerus spinipes TaxID=1348599 RepID=A0AAD9RLS6_9HYME|nr:hypothetical protein KPH14_005186 [Odynerus spinipes]
MYLLQNPFNFFFNLIINLIVIALCINAQEPELQLLNVVFRHGDPTPTKETYPNDPYQMHDFYPVGRGELTNNGKKRAYRLGKFLRLKYGNFLSKIYTPGLITARATDYSRTKMSLDLVLAALFPPEDIQKWHDELNWQPIPITYVPISRDNLLLSDGCPLFVEEYNRVLGTPEVIEKMSKFSEMNSNLTKWTGKNISTPLDMYDLYTVLMAQWMMGLPLPEWTISVFPDGQLRDGINYAFQVANSNPKLRRLYGGPLLRKMIEDMVASRDGELQKRQLNLYSAHQTSIGSMLNVLNVYKPHVPEYSSAVILELLRMNETYYVKVMYYKGIPSQAIELQIPGCQIICPLNKFMELTADIYICTKNVQNLI